MDSSKDDERPGDDANGHNEDDVDNGPPAGYVQLGQTVLGDVSDEEDDAPADSDNDDDANSNDKDDEPARFVPGTATAPPMFVVDRAAVTMTDADAAAIRATMAAVSIPEAARPAWARELDEAQWMPRIVFKGEEDGR